MNAIASNLPGSMTRILAIGLAVALASIASATTVVRTTTCHQLTSFPDTGIGGSERPIVISADGSTIAMARLNYSNPRRNDIYRVNFDGSGLALVDSYVVQDTGANLGISADGSRILSSDGYGTVRMVNGDGSNAHQVIKLNGGYPTYRLSADGTRVFFSMDRVFTTTPDTGPRDPGLYVVGADGNGLRQLASPTSFAQYFGVTPAQILNNDGYLSGWNGPHPFGISDDGSKFICYLVSAAIGWRVVGLTDNGTTSTIACEFPLSPTPVGGINRVGLSGDGSMAYYYLARTAPSSGEELGVFDWGGGGRRTLIDGGGGYGVTTLSMSTNGSKLLFGATGRLFNTDGSGEMELIGPTGPTEVMRWGLYFGGLMSGNAKRFVYTSPIGNGPQQAASLEINPATLGQAPAITEPSILPDSIHFGGQTLPAWTTWTTWAARAPGGLFGGRLAAFAYRNGRRDQDTGSEYFFDDGSGGDTQAGDGIFGRSLQAYTQNPGPRTVRFKGERLGSDSLYHATVIECAPFFVLANAPSGPPPAITTINPPEAPPGTTVTITGSGFDPTASNNIVIFGSIMATVVSVNPAGTELVVIVPPDAGYGAGSVTVSSAGQTSAGGSFTVIDPDAVSLEANLACALRISGVVGASYRIDWSADLATGSWVPLTTITLTQSPQDWVDLESIDQNRRFYRAVRVP